MSSDTKSPLRYKRILLKLSGEALMGEGKYGIHPPIRASPESLRRMRL